MTDWKTAALLLGCCGLAAPLAACPSSDNECADGACVPPGSSSGNEGGADVGTDAAGDPCAKTPTDPKCLDESTSLFVSGAKGDDANAEATKAKPLRSITAALGKLTPQRKRILVCEGTYAEDLTIAAAANGVSIIGGLNCDWAASTNKPTIGKTASPMKILGANGVTIAKLVVKAADTQTGSSIAVFAANSQVAFSEVNLTAGKAGKGDNGTEKSYTFPTPADLLGNSGDLGGAQKKVVCPGGQETIGGKGGPLGGFDGEKGSPGGTDNAGKNGGACNGPGGGGDGASASPTPTAKGASTIGTLTASAWIPSAGEMGADGAPGQGGGGGAGQGGGVGGSGGAGGCGGAGGGGGKGGGASLALASFESSIAFLSSELNASDAGNGGAGATGQAGQADGGFGRNGQDSTGACKGGNGGSGGNGASGGGGAGGISVGILFTGTEPTRDDATKAATRTGKAGTGGGPPAGKGKDGVAAATLKSE